VSTDAAHRHLYAQIRGVDGFDQMATNVGAFSQRIARAGQGPQLSLWFTAMRENLAELPDLVRLAQRLGVGEVYVQRLVFYGQGLAVQEQSLYRKPQGAEEDLLSEAEALAHRLGVAFRASGATSPRDSLALSESRERPWTRCYRPWSLMYITANGNVLPCCFSPFTSRDYPGLVLGNAFGASVAEIWHSPSYERFRTALLSDTPHEACDRCGMYWSL
jgi:MoaA/NifB/PqqE/SkfB family radical SAM enzyme